MDATPVKFDVILEKKGRNANFIIIFFLTGIFSSFDEAIAVMHVHGLECMVIDMNHRDRPHFYIKTTVVHVKCIIVLYTITQCCLTRI